VACTLLLTTCLLPWAVVVYQVPQRLAALCCSSSNNSQLSFQQHAAVFSLLQFMLRASQQDWFPGTVADGRPVSKLAKNLAEQLLQSGFLQQLPVLLSKAADQLEAAQDEQEMLASTQLSDKQRNALLPTMLPFVALLQQYATQLLALLPHVGSLTSALPAAVVTAGQRLVCAAVQHSCRCLELLPDQTAPRQPMGLANAALAAITAFFFSNSTAWCCSTADTTSSSNSSSNSTIMPPKLAQVPEKLRASACCILLLLALCQHHGRKLHRQLKQGSDDSKDHSSSIWQYACAQHSRLPQPYLQLCQALGYSSREFLYVACSSQIKFRHKGSLKELFSCLTGAVQAELMQQQQEQQQQQPALNFSVQGRSPRR